MTIRSFSARRSVAASVVVLAVPVLLAWWVKGDLEMAWLIAMPLAVLGSALGGAFAGFLAAGGRGIAVGAAAAGAVGIAGLVVALNTPHGAALSPSTALVEELERVAADTAVLRRALEAATGTAGTLAAGPGEVRVRAGWRAKRGFSFRSDVREPTFEVTAAFAVGPASPVLFEAVRDADAWQLRARAVPQPHLVNVQPVALRRLFAGVPQVEGAPHGPVEPGSLMLVRASHAERDWELRLLRVAAPAGALTEVARLDAAAIRARLRDEARKRGLDPGDDIVVYFRPGDEHSVLLSAEPAFRFFVSLEHPRYRQAQFLAVIDGDSIGFVQERVLARQGSGRASR